jgi:hypothetical protein
MMLKTEEKMGPVSSCAVCLLCGSRLSSDSLEPQDVHDLESSFRFTKGLLGLKCIEKEETSIP